MPDTGTATSKKQDPVTESVARTFEAILARRNGGTWVARPAHLIEAQRILDRAAQRLLAEQLDGRTRG